MSKKEYQRLLELVNISKQVGYSLTLGDRIKLITFTEQGKTNETYAYDYDETNCIQRIEVRINEQAQRLYSQWGSHFLEFAPIAFTANHRIDIGKYTANVIAHVDATGNLVTDTAKCEGTNEKTILQCPFSSDGLHQVSNYFTDLFYGIKLREFETTENSSVTKNATLEKEDEEMSQLLNNEDAVLALVSVWYAMSDKQRKDFANDHKDDRCMRAIYEAQKKSADLRP